MSARRARIETPYPSARSTARALGVSERRRHELTTLVDRILRASDSGAGHRRAWPRVIRAGSARPERRPRAPAGPSGAAHRPPADP